MRPQEEFYQKSFKADDKIMGLLREKYIPYDGQIPLGFKSPSEFFHFSAKANEVVQSLFPGTKIFIAGSSVTGVKYTNNQPFDEGRVSDFDLELVGDEIFNRAGKTVRYRFWDGMRSATLREYQLKELGLLELQQYLSKTTQREVHFIISRSFNHLLNLHVSPLIRLP